MKTALIIGAGPAGLTAGLELIKNTDIKPIVLESTNDVGGISKTSIYKGNRIDIGGHRFFSKSKKIMNWWLDIMPVQKYPSSDDIFLNRQIDYSRFENMFDIGHFGGNPEKCDDLFLIRNRISRILFLKKLFDYPITVNMDTLKKLGFSKTIKIGLDYLKTIFHQLDEDNLENYYINHFGRELYETFFKNYTYKIWGVECRDISADWGAQRVKGLNISKAISHAIYESANIKEKNVETSLIEQFIYPKLGPGQLWQKVADKITEDGGEILLNHEVREISLENNKISAVTCSNGKTFSGDYLISSMPIKDLVKGMGDVPGDVYSISQGLVYRDFITVGVLLDEIQLKNETDEPTINNILPDTWIYVQESDVKLGRVQIFNNWSPYLVKDSDKIWLGLEYFCNEDDDFWNASDSEIVKIALDELEKINFADKSDVIDTVVLRVPKAYPAYFGSYDKFSQVRNYLDNIENLFLIGRNGMHRYNNMDHSMLTAMEAVENIRLNKCDKSNIWNVNSQKEYHETR